MVTQPIPSSCFPRYPPVDVFLALSRIGGMVLWRGLVTRPFPTVAPAPFPERENGDSSDPDTNPAYGSEPIVLGLCHTFEEFTVGSFPIPKSSTLPIKPVVADAAFGVVIVRHNAASVRFKRIVHAYLAQPAFIITTLLHRRRLHLSEGAVPPLQGSDRMHGPYPGLTPWAIPCRSFGAGSSPKGALGNG